MEPGESPWKGSPMETGPQQRRLFSPCTPAESPLLVEHEGGPLLQSDVHEQHDVGGDAPSDTLLPSHLEF